MSKRKSKIKPIINAIKAEVEEVRILKPTQAQQDISQVLVKAVSMALATQGMVLPEEAQSEVTRVTSIVICDLFAGLSDTDKLFFKRIVNEYKKQKEEVV